MFLRSCVDAHRYTLRRNTASVMIFSPLSAVMFMVLLLLPFLNHFIFDRVNDAKIKDTAFLFSRDRLLVKLGDCCMKQAEYHLACQKYTQAGDKEKVIKFLIFIVLDITPKRVTSCGAIPAT